MFSQNLYWGVAGLLLSHCDIFMVNAASVNTTVSLQIPSSPPPWRQVIDARYQSYSIEFNYMLDYAGNQSQPNEFSRQMLQNLKDISGSFPIIRAGGSTQNRAVYYPNQTEALNETFTNPGDDQPSALTIGPAWLESFQQFPNGTQYIYGLNFYNGSSGLDQTVLEAIPAVKDIGTALYAFEIGNEVDSWAGGSRRPANWTIQNYVDEWLEYSAAIDGNVTGAATDEYEVPFYQGCAFEAPRNLGNGTVWNVANAVSDGIASNGRLRTVSDHEYMGAACAGAAIPTLKDNLLNHYHMTGLMYYHEVLSDRTTSAGVPYVIGETNSISCQGLTNISDVFGAAIWSVDYILYGAVLNVSRMYFHNGTPYRYSAWQPVAVNGTAPYAKPLYYGNLFTSTAFAGGAKQIVTLANETTFTAYAIYDAANGSAAARLESVAVVNLEMFNATQDAGSRPYVAVQLPLDGEVVAGAQVRRLTAPGVDVKDGITFAGQYVDSNGQIVGTLETESLSNDTVLVGAGEAVLVSL